MQKEFQVSNDLTESQAVAMITIYVWTMKTVKIKAKW